MLGEEPGCGDDVEVERMLVFDSELEGFKRVACCFVWVACLGGGALARVNLTLFASVGQPCGSLGLRQLEADGDLFHGSYFLRLRFLSFWDWVKRGPLGGW